MADVIDVSTPESGAGDGLREGGVKINAKFAADDILIAANTAKSVKLIQSKSFVSPSTSAINNSSSTVYVDTDLTVSITTISASSKLRVAFTAPFESNSASNTGIKGKIQSNTDAAGWVDVLFGNQTDTFQDRDPNIASANSRWTISATTQIDSPGAASVVQFKLLFAPFTDSFQATYSDSRGMRMMTVDEILET